jgi:hypothetical protein
MSKQVIVEFRFPITDEVLRSAVIQIQRTPLNEPYYSFTYVSDSPDRKEAVRKAREYLNRLFGRSVNVTVQEIDIENYNTEGL